MNEIFWLGSSSTYDRYESLLNRADFAGFRASDINTDEAYREALVSLHGDVAIVNIKGSLVSGATGLLGSMFGVTGYDDIKAAAMWAVSRPDVKALVYNVDSGGGDVAGVNGTAEFISKLSTAKPSVTFTDGYMASAAAWIGTATNYVIASDTALVGSVGILTIHSDRSQSRKAAGINDTVVRAGSEKALANPYEPLSDKAKENLQSRVDALYDVFISRMALNRNVSKVVAEEKFGQGREFVGQQAVKAGLVDKVGTLEDAVEKARKLAVNFSKVKPNTVRASIDTDDNRASMENSMPTTTLTDEQLEALAQNVQVPTALPSPETKEDTAPVVASETSMLDKLLAATAETATLKIANEKLTTDMAAAGEQISKLLTLGRQQVKTLGLHFGVQSAAVDTMDVETVLSEYARLSALFVEKFPAGRVAAPAQKAEAQPLATLDPLYAAHLRAAKSH